MEKESRLKHLINDIDTILESQTGDTKTETLARQRGYLTGWLARLGAENRNVHEEIKARLHQSSKKR